MNEATQERKVFVSAKFKGGGGGCVPRESYNFNSRSKPLTTKIIIIAYLYCKVQSPQQDFKETKRKKRRKGGLLSLTLCQAMFYMFGHYEGK